MKLQYVLGCCFGFVATGHFELGVFASRIGRSDWSVQPWAFLMQLKDFEMDNSLKWVPFNLVSGQIASNAL